MDRYDLLPAIARREPGALEHFQRMFGPAIRAIALKMVHDEADAEEVVQDVMWSVWRRAGSFRGDSDPWRWVHMITRNAALMLIRRRRPIVPLEPEQLEVAVKSAIRPMMARTDSADDVLSSKQTAARIFGTLGQQLDKNQELFDMVELQGLDREEVADQLGITMSALKARLHRVRKSLRAAALSIA